MHGKLITAPDGLRGFDVNGTLTPLLAQAFRQAGYRFAVRYVRRAESHPYDITTVEADAILRAGLGLMLVQHVHSPGWMPTGALGGQYGATAAHEAIGVGYPRGCIVWCDLEGVGHADPRDVAAFCNAWHDYVKAAGYEPGLYVGYGAGLNGRQLYSLLKYKRYWSAYNLNADSFPAVRGVQMRQGAYPGPRAAPGLGSTEYDINQCKADNLGDRIILLVDNEWTA